MLLPKAEVFMKLTCLDSIHLGTTELNQNEIVQERKLKHCHPNLVGEDARFAHGHVIFPVAISNSVCTLLLGEGKKKKRVTVSPSWERSQLSFLLMPVCCPINQCWAIRVLPKYLFSLDLANMSVCPTEAVAISLNYASTALLPLREANKEKKIKFLHH